MSEEQQPMNESDEPQQAIEPEREQPAWPRPRIYVASLSDYNAGRLHGRWVDAAQSAEELHAAIGEMLAASPEPVAEEWAIHDYEGFGSLHLDEYEAIERVAVVARGIGEHGPAFAAWAAQVGLDEEGLSEFENCYLGQWDSVTTYAEQFVEDYGIEEAIQEHGGPLAPYIHIDVDALAGDLLADGHLSAADAPDGGVFLFGQ